MLDNIHPIGAIKFALMLICLCLTQTACQPQDQAPAFSLDELQPGGAATVTRLHTRSYVYPGGHIRGLQQLNFWTGFSLFRDPWVIAPSSTKDRDGLGPLFNTRSCISCHHAGARGPMPEVGVTKPSSLLIRFGGTDANTHLVDEFYGDQLQPRSIHTSVPGEGKLKLAYKLIRGRYPDGQEYELRQPQYQVVDLSNGPLHSGIGLSPRYAPSIYGMGLLDAISDQALLAQEDKSDKDNNGISGHYNRVPNVKSGELELGRYGFKAKHPNLAQQVAAAFNGDIGITNSWFPRESCTKSQVNCQQLSLLGEHTGVEIPDKLLELVIEFNAHLGIPPARELQQQDTLAGRELFYRLGCQQCHTPSYTTDKNYQINALAGQKIWPYTDLALHDMGPGLADGVYEFSANGNEWRTPPLWGIGLQQKVLGRSNFLHDGRARSLEEAILWHAGEASASQQTFIQLTRQQRQQVLAFLRAI